RHEVDRVADRPQQKLALQRCAETPACEIAAYARNLEGPDHADMAEVAHLVVRGDSFQASGIAWRLVAVVGDHILVAENIKHGQRGCTGDGIAGVRMRMQKAARRL